MRDTPLAAAPLRSPQDTARELDALRAQVGARIAPEDFDRYRARARQLRAEARQHLVDAALSAARAQVRHLFERDAAPGCAATPRST
ncbi:MAG: hypothetical protein JNK67_09995 [Alphaproteobacteria bacterium]|nr:hypothetical protein [Alphaproteobacteria bacterium]